MVGYSKPVMVLVNDGGTTPTMVVHMRDIADTQGYDLVFIDEPTHCISIGEAYQDVKAKPVKEKFERTLPGKSGHAARKKHWEK